MSCRHLLPVVAGFVCLAATNLIVQAIPPAQGDEPSLSDEQKETFLLKAKVVKSKQTRKGITSPWQLTLSDGSLTHDAAFQSVEERKPIMKFQDGRTEIGFRDSYHYDIAARELAKLLGLADMIPVTVERRWNGNKGALSWWVPWKWDEEMRIKQKLEPPDIDAWNHQMYKVRIFVALVADTDRNLGNILITEDWKIWMIDFTRAFRLHHDLQNPKDLTNCDRNLLEALRRLDGKELSARTKDHLTTGEVQAVMARRDKIVEYFEKLIAEKGEKAVFY